MMPRAVSAADVLGHREVLGHARIDRARIDAVDLRSLRLEEYARGLRERMRCRLGGTV